MPISLPSRERVQGAIFRHLLKNRFPAILLPRDFRLLVQMRRGSSTSFNMTLSLAYAIKANLKYRWTPDLIEFARSSRSRFQDDGRSWMVAAPYDARSLELRRATFHTTPLPRMISTRSLGRAFVRLRNPYDQFRSHSVYLSIQFPGSNAAELALDYLTDFAHDLETASGPDIEIVPAETYFTDKSVQLEQCFNFFGFSEMTASVAEAIATYSAIEERWSALVVDGVMTPRMSYQSEYREISDEPRQRLDQLLQSPIFSEFYSADC